jgi:hypothetical protein
MRTEVRLNHLSRCIRPRPHIHFKVILAEPDLVTGQLIFRTLGERLLCDASYRERKEERDTMNANDFIFQKQAAPTRW